MTDEAQGPQAELHRIETALEGLYPLPVTEQLAAAIESLEKQRDALRARLEGDGAIAQGEGAVAAGKGGAAIGAVYGDVHFHSPNTTPEKPDEFGLRKYLTRLFHDAGHLRLTGVDPALARKAAETRLNLRAVYTALLTTSSHGGERNEGALHKPEMKRLSALEQLDQHQRLVLLGDPGRGKSTFVNFVALCLAGEALGQSEANLELLRAPLPEANGSDAEPQAWGHGTLVPLRIVLRDFASRKTESDGLWEFLVQQLADWELEDLAPQLRQTIEQGRALLLLDGLDEVPEAEEKGQSICRAVEEFCTLFGQCRVLVTSRIYAYQKQQWKLPGFEEATLAPFSQGQIHRFVSRWYRHVAEPLGLTTEQADGQGQQLLHAISTSDRLRFLAERPLLLTLMASLHSYRGGTLPESRERLYHDTVELLLEFWDQRKPDLEQPSLSEWLEVDRDAVRSALDKLAFEVHSTHGDLEGTADVPEEQLIQSLIDLGDRDRNPLKLVDFLSQRAGLLEPRGVKVYTFPHRTFQEYLAACHLTTGNGFPEEVARLARSEPERWREVALLAGAKAARGTSAALWLLVEALCFRHFGDEGCSEDDAWGALLATQALVESGEDLKAVAEFHQAKVERLRCWMVHLLGSRLPAVERARAGTCLAKLGDPRFDSEAWFLPKGPRLGFCEVPEGSFLMGSDQTTDPDADEDETPQHELHLPLFYIAQFPVTVEQFRFFVEDSGYADHHPASLAGPANYPVVAVNRFDAWAYCSWLEKKLRLRAERTLANSNETDPLWQQLAEGTLHVGLPSEAEWEKAARGDDGRIFPWGNQPDAEKANYDKTGIGERNTVGCFQDGKSPVGCEEMAGNVWEWTRSAWGEEQWPPEFTYPYAPHDGREENNRTIFHTLRGGADFFGKKEARSASRLGFSPESRSSDLGFRVGLTPLSLHFPDSDV